MPFEGTGATSGWRLEFPCEIRQFDYNTIADVIIHVKYTAREGGSGLKKEVNSSLVDRLNSLKQDLKETGLHIALNMKHDFPNEWNLLTNKKSVSLSIDTSRLPYMAQALSPKVEKLILIAKTANNSYSITVNDEIKVLTEITTWHPGDNWKLFSAEMGWISTFKLELIENFPDDLILVVKYSF